MDLGPDDKTHASRNRDKPLRQIKEDIVNARPNSPAVPFEAMEVPNHTAQYALKCAALVYKSNGDQTGASVDTKLMITL